MKCLRLYIVHLVLLTTMPRPGRSFFQSFSNGIASMFNLELCNDHFIPQDINLLKSKLENELYGQSIVRDKLIAVLKSHYENAPQKPLVISMHGWTGGGKNHVSKMVVDSTYRLGFESKFVHLFSARLHFPLSTKEAVEKYSLNLQQWIKGNVTACPRSIFIFDEVDRLPGKIVEAIKPFFDYYTAIDSIDYRQTIFIFLSNIGGNVITSTYLKLWQSGLPREKMEYMTFEKALRDQLYNTDGFLERSTVIEDHLISLYLPFLPLERVHVAMCIRKEMKRLKLRPNEKDVENILQQIEFYNDQFSTFGCKRVNDLVALLSYRSEF